MIYKQHFVIPTCVLLSILFIQASFAATIDVNIKGVDDGIKTSRQRDYKETALFAKRETIERAGVKIKSMTTVKNVVMNSDYIESKAEAVLLPGYNIMDMGYAADGTYQVVLIGKVKTGQSSISTSIKKIAADGWRFVAYNDGTVLDKKTNLMWAAEDNGRDINWEDAKRYCQEFKRGGYTDWRMPTQDEVAGLYDKSKKQACGIGTCYLTKLINVTNCGPWTSETRGSKAAYFMFPHWLQGLVPSVSLPPRPGFAGA